MEKKDYKKIYRDLYNASDNEIKNIKIPKLNYLAISGDSDIDSQFYRKAIKTLYELSYNLKFYIKNHKQVDYIVMPLEALWNDNTAKKQWTLMIMQPEIVTEQIFFDELDKLKNNKDLLLKELKFITYDEENCLQILHRGSYINQKYAVQLIKNEIIKQKLQPVKLRHEIYLNDPQRVSIDKLKTIIRQPYIKN